MAKLPTIKREVSSGGVMFRKSDSIIEVALVAIKGGTIWCLPKGVIDKNEKPPVTALREVREETGLTGKIVDKIGQISYWYFLREKMIKVHKTVHFFLMRCVGGSTDGHDFEVDEARWFAIDEAIDRLNYKSEKEIMKKAKIMIEERMLRRI